MSMRTSSTCTMPSSACSCGPTANSPAGSCAGAPCAPSRRRARRRSSPCASAGRAPGPGPDSRSTRGAARPAPASAISSMRWSLSQMRPSAGEKCNCAARSAMSGKRSASTISRSGGSSGSRPTAPFGCLRVRLMALPGPRTASENQFSPLRPCADFIHCAVHAPCHCAPGWPAVGLLPRQEPRSPAPAPATRDVGALSNDRSIWSIEWTN